MPINFNILSLIIKIVGTLGLPAVFIWSLNTLFALNIPLTFKSWLASFLLLVSLRFFLNKSHYHNYNDYYDDYYDNEEEEEEEETPPPKSQKDQGRPPSGKGRLKRVK